MIRFRMGDAIRINEQQVYWLLLFCRSSRGQEFSRV